MVRTLLAALLALLPTPLLAAPVPAGGKPKDVTELPVAANAMLVVQLNGLDRSKERLAKMLEGVGAEAAKDVGKHLDEGIKQLTAGRDLAGVDGKGRVFVAVGSLADLVGDEPPVAVLLPVEDYKTFRAKSLTAGEQKSFSKGKEGVDEFELEGSGTTTYLTDTGGGYVVLSPSKAAVEGYAGKYDKLTAKKLGTLAESFLAADAALFVNVERVNEEYGQQIAQGRALVGQLLQLGGAQLEKGQIETAKVMIEGLFQVVEDAKGIVIALEARPEGMNLRLDGSFTADSTSDKALKAEAPTALKALNTLPKGMTSYSASKWGPGFAAVQRRLAAEFAADNDDKAAAAMEKLAEAVADAGETVSVGGPDFAGVTITTYKDPGKVANARKAVFAALGEGSKYSNLVLKAAPKVADKSEKHAGFDLYSVGVEVDYAASVKNAADDAQKEAAIEAMKKMMPEKQTIWFGSDGKRYAEVRAKDFAAAKKLLDEFTSPKAKTGDDKMFTAVRSQLPDEANYLMLVDAVNMLSTLGDYAGTVAGSIPGGAGGPAGELPKFGKPKGDPTYLGVAFAARGESARFDLFIPVQAMKAVMQSIEDGEKEKKKD